ncbi:ribosomal protein S18-alanine N-acetyltransferase [Devosia sp. 1566]|uniref:ribosomal protein S18-alanine N-acetyltransferase n=1 Tax=unclassified Devosia TaxID=196773 RepID=UPI000FDB1CFF|nr:ribosomal protein S18-alanine N-acetyltransferase [Devosia sp. 1566]
MRKLWLGPHGLHVEPAQVGDAEVLAAIHAQGFFRGWSREEFADFLQETECTTLVACDPRRQVAGFILVRLIGDEAELLSIAVEPKWRGKRVGQALLRAALDDLLFTNARRMFLEVDERNSAALRLYRSHGFVEVGRRKGYYPRPDGSAATALVMAADLG